MKKKSPKYKILCVDDEKNILNGFRRSLHSGYDVHLALGGQAALDLIEQENEPFAVIVSDFNMPGMNGIEFLKQAKITTPKSVQIMLTGNAELEVAEKAINETDIFQYLRKPCPRDVLKKAISDAGEHYSLLTAKQVFNFMLEQKNKELEKINEELNRRKNVLESELHMAKSVFTKIAERGSTSLAGFDHYLSPMDDVSGDLIMSQVINEHTFYVMLGDITGHGLPAALGAMPVADTFVEMVQSNLKVEQIAGVINDKMCNNLPDEVFCAAIFIRVDYQQNNITVWQGGLPDALLVDKEGQLVDKICSENMPLGIMPTEFFEQFGFTYPMHEGLRLITYSDGITEQVNAEDEMFGEDRLLSALKNTPENESRIDYVIKQHNEYRGDTYQSDDVSILELDFLQIRESLANPES